MDWGSSNPEPPLIFLHAFTANGLASLPLGKLLAGRRRMIAPDLRGRGRSDMPAGEYGIPTHYNDMLGLLNRLRIERCVVVGHSFGAMIAMHLAAKQPDRVLGVVLYDGGVVPSPEASAALDAYYSTLQYHYASDDQYVERFRHAPLYQPWTDDLELLVRSNLVQQPDGSFMRRVPRYVIDADRRSDNLAHWQQLPELYKVVTCPVLMVRAGNGVFGRDDQVISDAALRSFQQALPTAQVVTLETAGHTTVLTIPSADRDTAIVHFLGLANG
jgi:lipase